VLVSIDLINFFPQTADKFSEGGETALKKPSKMKLVRIQHGMTAREVAKLLKMTPGHLSNLECGRREVSIDLLQQLAKIYHVDAKELI